MGATKIDKELKTERDIFITIDDLYQQAQNLLENIEILGEYKYPLMVRRGSRKEVKDMIEEQAKETRMIKAGKKTYFLDIKDTKEGKPYLLISESWFRDDEDEKPERNYIAVFPEQAKDFALAVVYMLDKIIQE